MTNYIKDKLVSIEHELNQLAEAVRVNEKSQSFQKLTSKQRSDIAQELENLKDAIMDVEAQVNRKTCYAS